MTIKERLADGRFGPGNPGGPGRPPKPKEEQFLRAIRRAVTPKDVGNVMQRLLYKAVNGDVQAAKLLLAYSVGPPESCCIQLNTPSEVVLTVKYPEGWGEGEFDDDSPESPK